MGYSQGAFLLFAVSHMTDINSPLLQSVMWNARRQRVEVKADLWNDERLWQPIGTATATQDQTNTYYGAVAYLFRAIEMKANAVSSVPFRIMRGETVIDESATWANKVGFWPNPQRDLWLVEAAIQFGPAYLHREKNDRVTKGLRYFLPSTITYEIDKDKGLTGFKRNIGGAPIPIPVEDMIYFWHPDPGVELGPPQATPVSAALGAAGVLYNLSAFTAAFWARGAIKATLLTIDGPSTPDAREDLKSWWQRAVTGINNAFSSRVISANVKPVVIGEGLDSLQNSSLTAEQRENICTAFGIPITLMNNTAAGGLGGGGVVSQADKDFYDKTIRYDCQFIAEALNTQLFAKTGYHIEFDLESLDVFQEDENQRATAFGAYVTAGLPLEVAGLMLGLELPEGWTWERIAKEKEANMPAMLPGVPPSTNGAQPPGGDVNAEVDAIVAGIGKALSTVHGNGNGAQIAPTAPRTGQDGRNGIEPYNATSCLDDLRKWRAKSKKRGALADFESDAIPADVMDAIKSHGENGWLEALDEAIADMQPTAHSDELTAFERVAAEYAKAADVFAQVINGNGAH